MKLPISVVIAITLGMMVVLAVVAFFYMSGGGAASRTAMQKEFTEGCLIVCSMEQRTDIRAVRLAYTPYVSWQRTCEQLYGVERDAFLQCLDRCSCGTLPTLCERLQTAVRDVGANCPFLCKAALEHDATRLLYQGCECESKCA